MCDRVYSVTRPWSCAWVDTSDGLGLTPWAGRRKRQGGASHGTTTRRWACPSTRAQDRRLRLPPGRASVPDRAPVHHLGGGPEGLAGGRSAPGATSNPERARAARGPGGGGRGNMRCGCRGRRPASSRRWRHGVRAGSRLAAGGNEFFGHQLRRGFFVIAYFAVSRRVACGPRKMRRIHGSTRRDRRRRARWRPARGQRLQNGGSVDERFPPAQRPCWHVPVLRDRRDEVHFEVLEERNRTSRRRASLARRR